MVLITELWLPILVASVLVFLASTVIHMFLGYHAGDLAEVPSEDAVRAALRGANIPPGDYAIPRAGSMKEMADPAFIAKQNDGPVAVLTVLPNGPARMGPMLMKWFAFIVAISLITAYLTGRTLAAGADYLAVFRVAGTVAFVAYAVDSWPQSIWFGKKWSTTLKNTFDGLVYALLTAGAFGWLWP
ncbi:MAG: hypothetical protein WEA09_08495 [Gemmatimonadota bacterium]